MTIGKRVRRKLAPLALCLLLLAGTSGCQILVLPFFIVSMTFQLFSQLLNMAFILPIRLLPIAIKYAPLALLFIENSKLDSAFYVEAIKKQGPLFRIEEFRDEKGSVISVIVAPSQKMGKMVDGKGWEQLKSEIFVLTEERYSNVTEKDLRRAWDVIKSKPGTVWMTGQPAHRFRQTEELFYV